MNLARFVYLRSVTANNYIPRFSENDYVANGWIKSDPDVIEIEIVIDNVEQSLFGKIGGGASGLKVRLVQPVSFMFSADDAHGLFAFVICQ